MFAQPRLTRHEQQANQSYNAMVRNMTTVGFARDNEQIGELQVDDYDRAEMFLARYGAQTGDWPVNAAAKLKKILDDGGAPPDLDEWNIEAENAGAAMET